MADNGPGTPRPGADRENEPAFARRGWIIAVAVGLTVVGTWLAGVVGLLLAVVVAGVFLLVASR
ncbi:hypothetical protein [Egicoccus sp. AB-alg6-2]|uniref:hypothetical protein n=1 Tax=Egicoccus sp. AB-alg6-2 TaxID=3242692 RepID=UPI00359D6153